VESSHPKLGRMEETLKGGQGPPWTVAALERERSTCWCEQNAEQIHSL